MNDHYSVAIVGAGPVGATAANLLGAYGINTLIVDREPDIVDYPRAAGVDDESLRTFQTAGLVADILRGAIQNVPLKFFDAAGNCLADIRPTTCDYGWYKRNIFMQPIAEAALRRGLKRFSHVRTMLGTEMRHLVQDKDGVTLHLVDEQGKQQEVRADYVIAADGGRSPIRTLLGIPLEGATHSRKWVVIDCANDPLDAPYTALHCDPRRPYVCAHLPDDHRRWEFMLFPGEDAEEMLTPDRVNDLLRHHVRDPSVVNVIRARVYTHHSRIATRFVEGRVALAGDAAHLMPPWAGQGMNTGIRDVTNLCWKLAAIVSGEADPSLLDTYTQERRPHAQAIIDLSTTLGRILSPTRPSVARARDWFLRAASLAPAVKKWTLEMRFKPIPHYRTGFVVPESPGTRVPSVGRMMTQPMVETSDGIHLKFDDVLGPWFAVIGFECDPLAGLTSTELAAVRRLRPQVIKVVESRAGERHHRQPCAAKETLVVEDVHNELRTWFQARGRNAVLVRPDRYVAAMSTVDDFAPALTRLADRFTGKS
ncbi:3-(3-hydroxy-phenyl)propionate hydroxylase [Kibdelosporangium banguiense]|uniref:3-(3-hydroxy-phenyl)propionate hydroxylase n=1 Tax=Kibdelosporangium banguiense TaxID=1365924 RepID=A0ABS4TW75_9PSEU|nr:bifunctional 3-(3-hydroxy-phenyl)propionate/3-hydroxycinnamic acid hydroxylase [Kibdelosporangium banguiense]MBP2328205.1 3-(3-hydroxy-phenyl)propionate hydroxylase [Kibdelosporangium banguiense]